MHYTTTTAHAHPDTPGTRPKGKPRRHRAKFDPTSLPTSSTPNNSRRPALNEKTTPSPSPRTIGCGNGEMRFGPRSARRQWRTMAHAGPTPGGTIGAIVLGLMHIAAVLILFFSVPNSVYLNWDNLALASYKPSRVFIQRWGVSTT